MANVATALKAEISRVARKEIRAESEGMRKMLAAQKTQIAALRKDVADLAKTLKSAQKALQAGPLKQQTSIADISDTGEQAVQRRFSAARLLAHRQKLGLSVAQYAAIVGVSSPTLRAWELGQRRPSESQMKGVVAARHTKPSAQDQ